MRLTGSYALMILLFLLTDLSFSQSTVIGQIIDSKSRQPLVFVNIVFDDNLTIGTITDVDGKFFIDTNKNIRTITCSYVGYEKVTIHLDSIVSGEVWIIEMNPSTRELSEVVVTSANPANQIMAKVIENRKVNDPERISSFKYTSYNKVTYDLKPVDPLDTSVISKRLDKVLKGGYIFMMESVTERKFIRPDRNNEVILGTRVSGFRHPSFAPLATDIQPFSFYKDHIPLIGINYLNPISNGSLRKYQFNLEETFLQRKDTVFVISFQPRAGKNFEGLSGLLYINSNKYAIQNVIAEPFEKGLIDVKLQQKYELIDGQQWFPKQLNFEVVTRKYPSEDLGMSINGKSYIENYELLPALKKREFSLEEVKFHELAMERDSLFWNNHRRNPLSTKETVTYSTIDSLGRQYRFDEILKFMDRFAYGRIPVKFLDIDLSKTLHYNQFEGTRLGLGLYTNDRLSRVISLGGFFGYGLRDNRWKYGGEFILNLDRDKEMEVVGRHERTLREVGSTSIRMYGQPRFGQRSLLVSRMDGIQESSITMRFRAFKYAKLGFSLGHFSIDPKYNYRYRLDDNREVEAYKHSHLNIRLRYAFREKLVSSFNRRLSLGTKYPIAYLNFTKGIKGFYGSQFNVNQLEARIEDSFLVKHLGKTDLILEGGFIDGSVPYGLLFTGEGSFNRRLPSIMKGYFQTSAPYEFASDRYVNFYFSHDFGSLLFQAGKFKPQLTVHHNMGWGSLAYSQSHRFVNFKTKEKGFFESGLQVDGILKINYLNVAYLGLGFGVYYRYGSYAHENSFDNVVFKFSVTYTTKR